MHPAWLQLTTACFESDRTVRWRAELRTGPAATCTGPDTACLRRLTDLGRDLAGAHRALDDAGKADEDRRGEWERACGRSRIGRGVVEVRTIPGAPTRLGPKVDERDRLVAEVRCPERDVACLVDTVGRLTRPLPHLDASASPTETARRLQDAARIADSARDGFAAAPRELEAARDRMGPMETATAVSEVRRNAMTSAP